MRGLLRFCGKKSKYSSVVAPESRRTPDSQSSVSVPQAFEAFVDDTKKAKSIPWTRQLFGRLLGKTSCDKTTRSQKKTTRFWRSGKVVPVTEQEIPKEKSSPLPPPAEKKKKKEDTISAVKPGSFTSLGFPNPLKFCYMNSCLQSLLTLEDFVTTISSQRQVWSSHRETALMRSFMRIEDTHFSTDFLRKFSDLMHFKEDVSIWNPEFADFQQKDAHEFLTTVLDHIRSLGMELQVTAASMGLTYRCPVQDLLMFKMQSTRTCKSCGAESIREEDFTNLSLNLSPGCGTVTDMLQDYQKEEELVCICECGAITSSQRSSFVSLPKVLILHLKRFRFAEDFQVQKVHYPVVLCRDLVMSSNQGAGNYSLVSIISHDGSGAENGHFSSDGLDRNVGESDPSDRWFTYNDARVTETTGASVCEQRTESSYILFYKRHLD